MEESRTVARSLRRKREARVVTIPFVKVALHVLTDSSRLVRDGAVADQRWWGGRETMKRDDSERSEGGPLKTMLRWRC